jgi:ABC-type multidrug transport system permease subunit
MRRFRLESRDPELALLRTPATIAVAAFVVGLTAGELAKAISGERFASVPYWIAMVICAPFLFPSRWFRSGARGSFMRAWLIAATMLSTMRLAYLCAWSYSRRSLAIWIVILVLNLAVGVALWVATYALIWRIPSRVAPEERAWMRVGRR